MVELCISIVKNNTTLTSEQVNDCMKVLDDALDRFVIYMGHKARCVNQNESLSKIEQDMKDKCVRTKGKTVKGLIVMDFKRNPIISCGDCPQNFHSLRALNKHRKKFHSSVVCDECSKQFLI